ncbi:threonine/serine exporter [Acutalibacter sp. 1XD8-33]|uniref:threonine/serine exporter family protein n=1 Tax=Acutalibacter sp. 1XD8-33 TaxID=2320081 RepID=UPI000EA0B94B|nr:threonine/serine exporter family protein [Acutalibacter sp. 1XD8-33]RKJ40896.1 threonine/serine exporter [Acutalibacter sp. 1XD8-33]
MNFLTLGSWALQTAVAFAATIAFAIIFHAPRRELLYTGFTGGAGWLVYVIATASGSGVVAASFLATLALAWLSRVFSFARKAPVTVFLICGIFPLVPGAGIYYTGYHFFMGQDALALDKGLETIKIAIAIALGTGIVLSLPSFLFTARRKAK